MPNPHGSFPKGKHKSLNYFKSEINKVAHQKYYPDILSYNHIHMERNQCIINRKRNKRGTMISI